LVTLAVPCFAALAGLRIFHDDASAMRLWRFLAQFGAILVLLTLLQSLVVPGTILIYEKWVYITDYTLTFVNRNTAATAIGVFLILNAGLLLESLKGTSFREIRLFLKVFDLKKNRKYRQILFLAVSCAVIVLGLMLTRSRGGVGSTLLAGLVLGGLALAFRPIVPERGRRTRFFVTVSICVLVVVAFLMLFGGLVVERIAQEGWEDNTRLCSYEAILKAIGDRWLLGWGFGTFVDVFPSYRDAACTGIIGIWDRAHNSYLEFIMGTGVFGAVVLVGVFWLIIAALVRGLGSRQSMNIPPCASLAILVLISLHSLVDFSLQIPGFAVLAVASLVCGVTISLKKAST